MNTSFSKYDAGTEIEKHAEQEQFGASMTSRSLPGESHIANQFVFPRDVLTLKHTI
jgi:hypothetical protein